MASGPATASAIDTYSTTEPHCSDCMFNYKKIQKHKRRRCIRHQPAPAPQDIITRRAHQRQPPRKIHAARAGGEPQREQHALRQQPPAQPAQYPRIVRHAVLGRRFAFQHRAAATATLRMHAYQRFAVRAGHAVPYQRHQVPAYLAGNVKAYPSLCLCFHSSAPSFCNCSRSQWRVRKSSVRAALSLTPHLCAISANEYPCARSQSTSPAGGAFAAVPLPARPAPGRPPAFQTEARPGRPPPHTGPKAHRRKVHAVCAAARRSKHAVQC